MEIVLKEKNKRGIYIAVFVSLASLIRVNFIVEGFIVAMSVLVMGIFIYCYEDLSAMYIAGLSGVFSPLFRMAVTNLNVNMGSAAYMVMPDMAFFFTYGIVFTCLYKYVLKEDRDIVNFHIIVFLCDFTSNIAEMSVRSLLAHRWLISGTVIMDLIGIAAIRTLILLFVLIAVEAHTRFLVDKENDRQYRDLLITASKVESEMRVMEKNADGVEEVMRKAYDLYKSVQSLDVPLNVKSDALAVAKEIHEIKADYKNVLSVFRETYLGEIKSQIMSISDIINLERDNLQSYIKQKNLNIDIICRYRTEFYVENTYKMMSVVRNLMMNSIEAIGKSPGRVIVTVYYEMAKEKYGKGNYCIVVRDNGPGIKKEYMEHIYLEGYSTKFDESTGNIQRGLGLNLVKDYVENIFDGKINVKSELGQYTEMKITIPYESFEENKNEILRS